MGGNYALTGDLIQLQDTEPPAIAPPTQPVGTDFDFDARTDNFAAVNAYYHCDRFFRLIGDLGFDIKTYFGGTLFPSSVDHRGSITNAGGIEINAHCLGNGTFGILRTTFMLADLTDVVNPLGLACDYRVVLHELGGHGYSTITSTDRTSASRTVPATASARYFAIRKAKHLTASSLSLGSAASSTGGTTGPSVAAGPGAV